MTTTKFSYTRLYKSKTQEFLAPEPRAETHTVEITLPRTDTTLIEIKYEDTSMANSVLPRFRLSRGSDFVFSVEATEPTTHVYLIGHGQIVPSGVVATITGVVEGQGEGNDQTYNLDITANDPLLAIGLAGHSMLLDSLFTIEFVHSSAVPVTYSATIMVGG
jgi:hypothetical protein